jgi:hypothetical protein
VYGIGVYVVCTYCYVPVGFTYLGIGVFVVITVLSLTGVFDVEGGSVCLTVSID